MKKPYVLIMLTHDHSKRYALDRGYNWMQDISDEEIDACRIADIVQVMNGRILSNSHPDWVDQMYPEDWNADSDRSPFITLWFNYYD